MTEAWGYTYMGLMRGYTAVYAQDVAMAHQLFGVPVNAKWPEVLFTTYDNLIAKLIYELWFNEPLNIVEVWLKTYG